jgi:hypothetical protein
VLLQVKTGTKIRIAPGKAKIPVAMIVPIEIKKSPRKIGILNGVASFKETGGGKITPEEFWGL